MPSLDGFIPSILLLSLLLDFLCANPDIPIVLDSLFMNKCFLPTSRQVLSTFQTFCSLWVQVVHLLTFKFRPGNGVFWGGVGDVLCMYISQKGVSDC